MEVNDCLIKAANERLEKFYENFKVSFPIKGGSNAVSEYADSVYSAAKESLIRKIAFDLNDILGLKGTRRFDEKDDINEIVSKMVENLPNPRKKRSIRSNKPGETKYTEVHKKICRALGESINKNYNSEIINMKQSDDLICDKVSEVIFSLVSGLHSEFSSVASDVSRIIRNLSTLMEYLKRSHLKIREIVDPKDVELKNQLKLTDEFYEKLVGEVNRQLTILSNLVGSVISPVNNDFVQLLQESEDYKGLVEDIKSSLGSEEFGTKLGYLLAGVSNLAQIAKTVDQALKQIGFSMKKYKETKGLGNLRNEIYQLLTSKSNLNSDGLYAFMKAADILYRNDMMHDKIIEYLENKATGGYCNDCALGGMHEHTGGMHEHTGGMHTGGVDGKDYKDIFDHKEGLSDKRLKEQEKFKKSVFTDFENHLLNLYQNIVLVVQKIGPKIGDEIPVSDTLMKFVHAFTQIEGSNRSSISRALSGYSKTGVAKDIKNSFLSSLEVLDLNIKPLLSTNALFKELHNNIIELIKLVEMFSEKVVESLAEPLSFKDTSKVGGDIVFTDAPQGYVERYASFGRAQFQLYYYSRIANIKRSMKRVASEKSIDEKDYEASMGKSVARMINAYAVDHKKMIDSLNHWKRNSSDWKSQEDFDKDLPHDTPGRALYYYVNTFSGYEPSILTKSTRSWPDYKGNLNVLYVTDTSGIDINFIKRLWNACGATLVGPSLDDHKKYPELIPIDIINPSSLGDWYHSFNSKTEEVLGCKLDDLKSAADTWPAAFNKDNENSLLYKRYKAAEKIAECVKELSMAAFDSKKGLLEVAQNVDLYLSSFTDSALKKPEMLLNLAKILQRVSMVRKFYTESSGDNLAKSFELFPAEISYDSKYNSVRYPGENTEENKNKSAGGALPVSATWNEHYYEYIKQVYENTGETNPGNHRIALELNDIFDDVKGQAASSYRLTKLKEYINKSVMGVRVLENILLAFSQIGNEQSNKTFMTHGAILKKLMTYVINSSYTRFYSGDNRTSIIDGEKNISLTPSGPLKVALSVSLRSIESKKYEDEYKQTDEILEIILKAICAKVLTVLGLYQIFTKPTPKYLSLNTVRSILGGGTLDKPKIIPEAMDLYVRLPLLIEWYRKIFVGKNDGSTRFISSGDYMLSLIPDITSPWGELLKTIFIKADYVEEGNYSEVDINTIITEINKIYKHYNSTIDACEGLVSEVNKRYRMLKTSDVNNYWNNKESDRFKTERYDYKDDDYVNFDLLDSENARSAPAPSARYEDINIINRIESSGWSKDSYNLVEKLHKRMYKDFHEQYQKASVDFSENEKGDFKILNYTFDGVIKNYKDELLLAKSDDEKYLIAKKAITDVGKVSEVSADKLLLLNELVVSPLTNLSSLYNTLRNVLESLTWMTSECLAGVLSHVYKNRNTDFKNLGVNLTDAKLLSDTAFVLRIDEQRYEPVLHEILRVYNPHASSFLRKLFVPYSELDSHGINSSTIVFNDNFSKPNECFLLSTKNLLKAHFQLFANLNACTHGKVQLEFTNQGYPLVNFNQLVEYAESVFQSIKKSISYLRPVIPKEILRRYENADNVGSVYWLEENLFSVLLYNEKKNRKFVMPAKEHLLSGRVIDSAFNGNDLTSVPELYVTLPQLNEVLKSSFVVIKSRKDLNGQRGAYERAIAEICLYNVFNKTFKQEVNSEVSTNFPFNLIELVDDLDPAVGRVRKMIFDKEFQAQLTAAVKEFGSIDFAMDSTSITSLYNLLRVFTSSDIETKVSGGFDNNTQNFRQVYNETILSYFGPTKLGTVEFGFPSLEDRKQPLDLFADKPIRKIEYSYDKPLPNDFVVLPNVDQIFRTDNIGLGHIISENGNNIFTEILDSLQPLPHQFAHLNLVQQNNLLNNEINFYKDVLDNPSNDHNAKTILLDLVLDINDSAANFMNLCNALIIELNRRSNTFNNSLLYYVLYNINNNNNVTISVIKSSLKSYFKNLDITKQLCHDFWRFVISQLKILNDKFNPIISILSSILNSNIKNQLIKLIGKNGYEALLDYAKKISEYRVYLASAHINKLLDKINRLSSSWYKDILRDSYDHYFKNIYKTVIFENNIKLYPFLDLDSTKHNNDYLDSHIEEDKFLTSDSILLTKNVKRTMKDKYKSMFKYVEITRDPYVHYKLHLDPSPISESDITEMKTIGDIYYKRLADADINKLLDPKDKSSVGQRELNNKINLLLGRSSEIQDKTAFILQRINFYDASDDNYDFFNKDKEDNLSSVFYEKGLLVQFNQAVASLLATFIEDGSRKFYIPLIDGLVNSRLSDAISAGNAIADLNITDINSIGYPSEGTILCASIARSIRTILNKRVENSKELTYGLNSLLEVSSSMKEVMKCNLPHFARLFEQLGKISVFYKNVLLSSTTLKYERKYEGKSNNFVKVEFDKLVSKTQKPYIDPYLDVSDSNCVRYYRTLLDSIDNACSSLLRSINQVYKDLNDSPIYGETYSNSVIEIKDKTGKYPITLPSGLQILLHHHKYEKGYGLPNVKLGSDKYKLNFIFRGMVTSSNRVVGGGSILDYFPGFVDVLNNYNALCPDVSKLPKTLVENSIKHNFELLDALFDLKIRNSWILDSSSPGSEIFRKEMYASAQKFMVNRNRFNYYNRDTQISFDNNIKDKIPAELNLAGSDKNQSIFYLSQVNKIINGRKVVNTAWNVANDDLTKAPDHYSLLSNGPSIANAYVYPDFIGPLNLSSFAFTSGYDILDLLSLFESSDVNYNKLRLSKYFVSDKKAHNERDLSRFLNILDLNIVPINFHVLGKDIPLINLLNYNFTFDKFVVEKLNLDPRLMYKEDFTIDKDKDKVKFVFWKLLSSPMSAVSAELFDKILYGSTGSDIPLDRPKYISDQIFNKTLLISLAPRPRDIDDLVVQYEKHELPMDSKTLTYLVDEDVKEIKLRNDFDFGKRGQIIESRFDTKIVRNLCWFSQLHRFLLWNIKEALRTTSQPVVNDQNILDPTMIDFRGFESLKSTEYHL